MKIVIWILIAVLSFGSVVMVEADEKLFARTYDCRMDNSDDYAWGVATSFEGNIVIVGYAEPFPAGTPDAWILMLNERGDVVWEKIYNTTRLEELYDVAITFDRNIFAVGCISVSGSKAEDAWIMKLDENGNVLWQKTYGGNDTDVARALAITAEGDIMVVGYTFSSGAGSADAFLLKLDENGDIIWQKTYGDSNWNGAFDVDVTPEGRIVIVGNSKSSVNDYDVWVLEIDSNGNVLWQKTYGGSNRESATGVVADADGQVIVAGETESFGAGSRDAWVLKIGKTGDIVWQKTYGGEGLDSAKNVDLALDGSIIIVGETESFRKTAAGSNLWLMKISQEGNIVWERVFGDGVRQNQATNLVVTAGNEIVVVGFTGSFCVDGFFDAWIMKTDKNGRLPNCEFCQRIPLDIVAYLSSSNVTKGKPVRISAEVTYSHPGERFRATIIPVEGVNVTATIDELETLILLSCQGNGTYHGAIDTSLIEGGTYRVVVRAEKEGYTSAQTTIILTVEVPTILSCSISKTKIQKGESIVVSGTIEPALLGKPIILTYTKPDGSTFNRTVTTGPDGTFRDKYQPDMSGPWSVKALWVGDPIYKGASSSTISLTVNENPFIQTVLGKTIVIMGTITLVIVAILLILKRNTQVCVIRNTKN